VTVKDAVCFVKISGDPRLADVAPVDREAHAQWAGRAAARPQSKLRCGIRPRLQRVVLQPEALIGLERVVIPGRLGAEGRRIGRE
jgi:hypothetical protein